MKFQIITVGKLKEKYLKDGIAEYLKRLQRYAVVEIVEVADEQTPDGASEAEEAQIKAKEAQRIQKYIKDDTYLIALAIEGKMFSSEQLAEKIGVTRQTIGLIESGNYNPSISLCIDICKALNRTLDDLFWPVE